MDTDASGEGQGAVLSQSIEGHDHETAYACRTLNRAKRKYCATRHEMCGPFNTLGHTCMASDSQCILTTVPCDRCEVFVYWSSGQVVRLLGLSKNWFHTRDRIQTSGKSWRLHSSQRYFHESIITKTLWSQCDHLSRKQHSVASVARCPGRGFE